MEKIVLKPSITVKQCPCDDEPVMALASPRLWDEDVDAQTQEAIDAVLGHLLHHGQRPLVDTEGDIIEIVTTLTNTMRQSVPENLSSSLKTMMDHIARWLCDYVEETNAGRLHITFGFGAQQPENAEVAA